MEYQSPHCDGTGKIHQHYVEYCEEIGRPGSRIPIGMIYYDIDCLGCPACKGGVDDSRNKT